MVRSVGPHLLRLHPNATINEFEKMIRRRLKVTHDLTWNKCCNGENNSLELVLKLVRPFYGTKCLKHQWSIGTLRFQVSDLNQFSQFRSWPTRHRFRVFRRRNIVLWLFWVVPLRTKPSVSIYHSLTNTMRKCIQPCSFQKMRLPTSTGSRV